MLGWSVHIKRGDENGETVLYAETTDTGLDRRVGASALKELDRPDYKGAGYGYPNRYSIRGDRLPDVSVYRYVPVAEGSRTHTREELNLASLQGVSEDEILWVELWDLS